MFSKKNIIYITSAIIVLFILLIVLIPKIQNNSSKESKDDNEKISITSKKCILNVNNLKITYLFSIKSGVIDSIEITNEYSYKNREEYEQWIEYYKQEGNYNFDEKGLRIYSKTDISTLEENQLKEYSEYKDMLEKSNYKCD